MTTMRRLSFERMVEELHSITDFEMKTLKELGLSEEQVKKFWQKRHEKEFQLIKEDHDSVREKLKF